MKTLILLALVIFTSCNSQPLKRKSNFKRLLPDTIKSWSGRRTVEDFHLTRNLERQLHLGTLENGIKDDEFRIWNLSSSYDPQVLFILKKCNPNEWNLRTLSFYRSKGNSISADYTRFIHPGSVDSLNLNQYFSIPSQSDLKAGDSYGCLDGEDVFMEIADSTKYRFLWYRCPGINKNNDSAFLLISDLTRKLARLSAKH